MEIPDFKIPKVIAEIGCNHKGEVQTAKQLIAIAKACDADYVKFQKRNPRELLTPEQYDAPYDNPNSYGKTYGEHREFLELDVSVHKELKKYAEELDVKYSTSVWDITSAREIASLQPESIKVPSACNNHWKMLEVLRDEYKGDVHISFGMTLREEEEQIMNFFKNSPDRLVIYACTSGYPVAFEDVCILEVERLIKSYRNKGRCKEVGYSGHHLGIAVDMVAVLVGAQWLERHFTLSRTWKGTDHAASLEPNGLQRITRDVRSIKKAWSYKQREILDVEQVQRDKLRYRG